MRVRLTGLGAVAAFFVWSTAAFADPVTITAGYATLYFGGDLGGFDLSGDGMHLVGQHHGASMPGFATGHPEVISDTLSPNLNAFFAPPATVNGTTYPSAFLFGELDLTSSPFVAPLAPDGTLMWFTAPFAMKGTIIGYSDFARTNQLFSIALAGTGSVESGPYRAVASDGGVLWVNRGDDLFRFSAETASPTPEPATMLLLLSGGLVIARARLKRS